MRNQGKPERIRARLKPVANTTFNILAIETARDACGVAVLRADGCVSSATNLRPRSHAEQLVPMAVGCVSEAGIEFSDLDAIAVSSGPGSYTGLRIGVSTAKGFAVACGARLVGVPTLQAYALAAQTSHRLYGYTADIFAIALRARRSEVYFAAFGAADAHEGLRVLVDSCVLSTTECADRIAGIAGRRQVCVGGDASADVVYAIGDRADAHIGYFVPGAVPVARFGRELLLEGHFEDVASFEPSYLKDYVAKQGGSPFERLPNRPPN